jgi:MFS family permease
MSAPEADLQHRRRFASQNLFASMSERNYRLFFYGQLVSVVGTFMQTVALTFLVLGLTHSGTDLGFVLGAVFLPVLLLTPFGGLIADRVDKRRLLYITQVALALLAVALAVLVASHVVAMWMVYLIALGVGTATAFNLPARQTFISEMVPPEKLSNAVSLNSVSVNIARVVGAAVGGVLVATLGIAICLALNGASYVAALLALVLMKSSDLYPAELVVKEKGQVRAGFRYALRTPELLVPLIMVAVLGTLTYEFPITLPLLATATFHRNASTYGLMAAVMACGAVLGGVTSASRRRARAQSLSVAAIGWGTAILAAALARNIPEELVALVFVGYGTITFNALAKTALQLASVPAMRGRVMALWAVAWGGSTVVGGPLVGWAAQVLGARWSLIIGGAPAILIAALAWPALRRIEVRARARGAAATADVVVT